MFIRKVFHTDKKNNTVYHTFKLIESVRTERGPRQRMILNLGADFNVPEEKWKDLSNCIEQIVTGQTPLFPLMQISKKSPFYMQSASSHITGKKKRRNLPITIRLI